MDHRGPALVAVAAPGSGKTRTLVEAVAGRVLTHERHPSECLAVAFTRLAAAEMQRRLHDRGVRGVTVGTFHAICFRLVKQHWRQLGFSSEDIVVYDRHEQRRVLKEVIFTSPHTCPQQTLLDALDHRAQTGEYPPGLKRSVVSMLGAYTKALLSHNAVDYSTTTPLAMDVISSARGIWKAVFVDEFQDLDLQQHAFFRALAPEEIFFVGDPDQLIYGWRGADVEQMRSAIRERSADVVVLDINYRSGDEIIDAANRLIRHNGPGARSESGRLLGQAMQGTGQRARIKMVPESMTSMMDAIQPMGTMVMDPDDISLMPPVHTIAVLARTNRVLEAMSAQLETAGIPHSLVGKRENLLQTEGVRNAMALLAFESLPLNPLVLERVMEVERIHKIDVEQIRMMAKRDGDTYFEVATETCPKLRAFYDELRDEGVGLSERLASVIGWLRERARPLSRGEKLALTSAVAQFTRWEPNWASRTPDRFMSWLNMRDGQDEVDLDARVQLMTIHAAKGLEFDGVVLCGLTEGVLPHSRSRHDWEIAEERRLMFVAVTRARRFLTLVVPAERRSRFVDELLGVTPCAR